MRFRLIYQGPLSPRQKDPYTNQTDRLAEHVQFIRKAFHLQLKELWRTNSFLSTCKMDVDWIAADRRVAATVGIWDDGPQNQIPLWLAMAEHYSENGYRFVPIVRRAWRLECDLSILLLRRDHMSAIKDGDLDNRLKTLIDGLRRPLNPNELRGNEHPGAGEDPFYVLLEDDSLITGITVTVDQLLTPSTEGGNTQSKEVHAVIDVHIRPIDPTVFTVSFL